MMEVKNVPASRIVVYCFAVLILLSVQQFASGSRGVCSRRLTRHRAESYYERTYYATTIATTKECGWWPFNRCPARRRIRASRAVGRTRYHTDYYYQQYCCSGYTGSPPCCSRVCPALNNIANGATSLYSRIEGNIATFSCNSGYCMVGSPFSTCLSNGSWSSPLPACKRVCPTLSNTTEMYVSFSYSQHCVHSVASFTCKFGYGMVGASTRICLSTGEWSGFSPNCYQLVLCPEPNDPTNGTASWIHRAVGNTIIYTCSSGYVLVGASSRTCQENEAWTETAPKCDRVCPVLDPPRNGTLVVSTYFVNGSASYSCNSGYQLVGSSASNCLSTGSWSSLPPTCDRVCPKLINLINGVVHISSYFVGDVATYVCDDGFGLMGPATRNCLSNGTWSIVSTRCDPVCHSLQHPGNGSVNVSSYFFGDTAHFSCDTGYELLGHSDRRCESNKLWSGAQPICKIVECHKLSSPHNGFVAIDSYNFGGIARFRCSAGHLLCGSPRRTCLFNGYWSGVQPFCRYIECTVLSNPDNGKVDADSTLFGDVAMYTCSIGYRLIGSDQRECLGNSTWSGTSPHCQRVCPVLDAPRNGTLVVSTYFVNGSASYSCNSGYQLVGSSTSNCLSTGSWSSLPPTCDRVCPKLTNLINGVVHISSYFVGDVATYDCDDGFGLMGPATRNCLSNGTWSIFSTRCDPVCHSLQHPGNGSVNVSSYFFGDIAHFSCDTGYELLGHSDRRCESNKLWSGAQPICKIVECHKLSSPHNGFVAIDSYNFGGIARFRCSAGHGLFGSPRRTCLFNSYWSGVQPFCRYIECTVLSNPENGKVDADSTLFGDVAMYTCSIGYRLIGSDKRKCLGNSTWSGTSPHCQLIECPTPAKPSNGHVKYTSLTVGSIASYSCSPGYIIEGSKIQFCLPSMMWKGVTPSCRSTTISSGDGSGDCDCVNGGSCHFALDGTEQGSGMDCVCPLGFSGNKCQDEGL